MCAKFNQKHIMHIFAWKHIKTYTDPIAWKHGCWGDPEIELKIVLHVGMTSKKNGSQNGNENWHKMDCIELFGRILEEC